MWVNVNKHTLQVWLFGITLWEIQLTLDPSALHQLGKWCILNTGKSSQLLQKYEKNPVLCCFYLVGFSGFVFFFFFLYEVRPDHLIQDIRLLYSMALEAWLESHLFCASLSASFLAILTDSYFGLLFCSLCSLPAKRSHNSAVNVHAFSFPFIWPCCSYSENTGTVCLPQSYSLLWFASIGSRTGSVLMEITC